MNYIIYQVQDDLAMITLNRPEVANGFHIPMCEEILKALSLADCQLYLNQCQWESFFSWRRLSGDEAGSR